MKRNAVARFFAAAVGRGGTLEEQATSARKIYRWWFDHPRDWEQPVKTLYITGWCLRRDGKRVGGIRARIGRRKFPGNYGIARSEMAAQLSEKANLRCGFAIAVPLPMGKSRLILEVKGPDGKWTPFTVRNVPGSVVDDSGPPQDAKYFIFNPGANPRIDFWIDQPAVWTKKVRFLRITGWCLAIYGPEIAEIRGRVRRRIFPARFGTVRPDIALIFENRPGSLHSGFSLNGVIPPGRSRLILEARSANGPWETFFIHSLRGPLLREECDGAGDTLGDYRLWIRRYDRLQSDDIRLIREQIANFRDPPLISVLLPVYNPNLKWLGEAIRSVRQQLYPHWELCIVDDASTDRRVWPFLERMAQRDRRIRILRRVENGHICAASNDALEMARGSFVALLDHDDALAPTALYFVAHALQKNPDLRLLYSDEDKIDAQDRRFEPYFKTDWNPELLLAQNYVSHLGVYRTDLVRSLGGFRLGFEGSQDHDLILRCAEKITPAEIKHLPFVLYHWRTTDESTASFATAKPYAQEAARRAVQEHLDRVGIAATVEPHYGVYLRVKYALPANPPQVSIIIPTRNRAVLLRKCIESILANTDYLDYELVILDNESDEPEALNYLEELRQDSRIQVERVAGSFNYSRLNNRGAELAHGSVLALLNNDIEVTNGDWLREMVSRVLIPEVGLVGARLWYPRGVIQHGGVILGAGGIAGHAHVGIRHEHGYFARPHLAQDLSAVTAACAVVRREVHQQVGGFDEKHLAVAFNDVDFCLRLRSAGYRVVWTPHAELVHHESASRGFEDSMSKQARFLAETEYMRAKWGPALENDPFYSPNLSLDGDFLPAFPPRVKRPWRSQK